MNDYTNENALEALHYLCKVRQALERAKLNAQERKDITPSLASLHCKVEALYISRIRSDFPPEDASE